MRESAPAAMITHPITVADRFACRLACQRQPPFHPHGRRDSPWLNFAKLQLRCPVDPSHARLTGPSGQVFKWALESATDTNATVRLFVQRAARMQSDRLQRPKSLPV